MSYCVKCGVELCVTEKKCPLCFTYVIHENDDPTIKSAYPPHTDKAKPQNKNIAMIGLLMLFLPAVICLLSDLLDNGLLHWSLYVLGAEACFYVYAFFPLLFKKAHVCLFLASDVLITCLYLTQIGYLSDTASWVLPLGVPMTVLTGTLIFVLIQLAKRKRLAILRKFAAAAFVIGLFTVLTEVLIRLFLVGHFSISWSLYVVSALLIVSIILRYIDSKEDLKDKIRRRIFM